MAPLKEDLATLNSIMPKINAAADEAAKLIAAVDAALVASRVGFDVEGPSIIDRHRVAGSGGSVNGWVTLCYDRDEESRDFCLCAVENVWKFDENGVPITNDLGDQKSHRHAVRSLQKCSRELKLAALPHIPALVTMIVATAKLRAKNIDKHLDSLRVAAADILGIDGSKNVTVNLTMEGWDKTAEVDSSDDEDGFEHDASYQIGFEAGAKWVDSERKATVRRVARKFGELIDSTDYESMFDSDDAMGVGYPIFKIVVGETDNGRDGSEGWWSDVSGGMDSSDTVYEPNYVRGFVEGVVEAANARK